MSGTVNIARALFTDEAFKDQPYTEREAFMWLVMEASWKDRTKRIGSAVVDLKRGQLAASIRFMADAWSWEKSTVDRFLKRLEKRDMIGTDSGTGVSVITICKYNDYQGGYTASGTVKFEKRDSIGTAAGQTRTPEVIPEVIKREAKASCANDAHDRFADFWEAVPRKIAKPAAQRAFAKALRSTDAARIIAGMQAYAASRIGQDQQYTAHPATWLNAERWNDEPAQLHSIGTQHAKSDRTGPFIGNRGMAGSPFAGGGGQNASLASIVARRRLDGSV